MFKSSCFFLLICITYVTNTLISICINFLFIVIKQINTHFMFTFKFVAWHHTARPERTALYQQYSKETFSRDCPFEISRGFIVYVLYMCGSGSLKRVWEGGDFGITSIVICSTPKSGRVKEGKSGAPAARTRIYFGRRANGFSLRLARQPGAVNEQKSASQKSHAD